MCLVLSQTAVASYFMAAVLPYHGSRLLEIAILALYALLFGWISIGFWTAVMGFVLLLLKGDRYAISRTAAGRGPIEAGARTAIIMPICNEDVRRVFAGLRATHTSLARTGQLRHFDFFVLSDSSDPDLRVAEIEEWAHLRHGAGERGRIFYRWRPHRIKRKSGNIADFCRHWGGQYRYMVVLDADSVMTGDCLVALVRLMEANPDAGIIQTLPRAVGRETLYARIQQFSTCVYGPLFAAGLHFWQLGESYYWGHNAIIRVAPFIRHCALGRLRQRGTLSREILSHDFVEAALMRRAGWSVWLAYDLPGSYEEVPPNLAEELGRDRRWCKGNLINSRLLLAEGLRPAHRAVFMVGVMVYLSAPLWFLFLLLSTALLTVNTLIPPQYFVQLHQLFPRWPEWNPILALRLLSATAVLLVLPKILSGVCLLWVRSAGRFGGAARLAGSILAEFLFSAVLAPIRMVVHTKFVVSGLLGVSPRWISPSRENAETTWGEALQGHGVHTLLGVVWAAGVYKLDPSFLWWLLPVVGALVLSVPVSVYSSRVSLGRRLRAAGFFLTPEESWPPKELRWTQEALKRPAPPDFVDAVVDPITNALVCMYGRARARQSATIRRCRSQLVDEALKGGPLSLTNRQKMTLLSDALALSKLHLELWTSPSAHPSWYKDQVRPFATRIPAAG